MKEQNCKVSKGVKRETYRKIKHHKNDKQKLLFIFTF